MERATVLVVMALAASHCLMAENPGPNYNVSEQKCINKFCIPPGYNKHEGPFKETGHTEIWVNFHVSQVVEIDDVDFSIKFKIYIGLTWEDPRIINLRGEEEISDYIPVDIQFGNYIWRPDLYIYDLKEITFPKYSKQYGGKYIHIDMFHASPNLSKLIVSAAHFFVLNFTAGPECCDIGL